MSKHKVLKLLSLFSTSLLLAGGSIGIALVNQCGNQKKPVPPKAPSIDFQNQPDDILLTPGEPIVPFVPQIVDQNGEIISECTFTLNIPDTGSPISNVGLQFDPNTGIISGTPRLLEYACYNLSITATYGDLSRTSIPFNIRTDAPSTLFRFTNLPEGNIEFHYGSPFTPTEALVIKDGNDRIVDGWTFELDMPAAKPSWLQFDPTTGVISGTPDVDNFEQNCTISAILPNFSITSPSFIIRNYGLAPSIHIETQPTDISLVKNASVETDPLQVVDQKGQAVSGCTFTLNYPTDAPNINSCGLEFDPNDGVIHGTATSTPYSYGGFSITATYNGLSDRSASFSIYNEGEEPSIHFETQPSSFTFSFRTPVSSNSIIINDNNDIDVTNQCTFTLSSSAVLPEGLTFDSSTGIISGAPIGIYSSGYEAGFTITATYGDLAPITCEPFEIKDATQSYASLSDVSDIVYSLGTPIGQFKPIVFNQYGIEVSLSTLFSIYDADDNPVWLPGGLQFNADYPRDRNYNLIEGTINSPLSPAEVLSISSIHVKAVTEDGLIYNSEPFSIRDMSTSFYFDTDMPASLSTETFMPMEINLPIIKNQDDIIIDNSYFSNFAIKDSSGNPVDWIIIDPTTKKIRIPLLKDTHSLSNCTLTAQYGDNQHAIQVTSNTFDIEVTNTTKTKYKPDGTNWEGYISKEDNSTNKLLCEFVDGEYQIINGTSSGYKYYAKDLVIPDEIWNQDEEMFYPLTKIKYGGLGGANNEKTIEGVTLGKNINFLAQHSLTLSRLTSVTLTPNITTADSGILFMAGNDLGGNFTLTFDGFKSEPPKFNGPYPITYGWNIVNYDPTWAWGALNGIGRVTSPSTGDELFPGVIHIKRKNGSWPANINDLNVFGISSYHVAEGNEKPTIVFD